MRPTVPFDFAHRLSTIRQAHQILVLDQGQVVERGKHAELCASGGAYSQLHQRFSARLTYRAA